MLDIEGFFELIDFRKVDHPFLTPPKDKPQAIVVVTSDSGLLGGLNMQVVSAALRELSGTAGKLIVIGERGKTYARESGLSFVAFGGIKDEERYNQALELRDYLVKEALSGSFGCLKVVYPRPVSFTVQRIETVSFFPFASGADTETSVVPEDMLYESEPSDIIEYLICLWMGQKLYEIFGLSRLAEMAARFVHLETSSQKLKDMDSKTRLEYFRVRHELIDRNMRELFASRLLFGS